MIIKTILYICYYDKLNIQVNNISITYINIIIGIISYCYLIFAEESVFRFCLVDLLDGYYYKNEIATCLFCLIHLVNYAYVQNIYLILVNIISLYYPAYYMLVYIKPTIGWAFIYHILYNFYFGVPITLYNIYKYMSKKNIVNNKLDIYDRFDYCFKTSLVPGEYYVGYNETLKRSMSYETLNKHVNYYKSITIKDINKTKDIEEMHEKLWKSQNKHRLNLNNISE